jgi:hypothetical protein
MKQITLLLIASVITLCSAAQNVGIGTVSPDATSKLEISSNNSGLLIPRLTAAQRIAISNPANGLLLFDTDSASFAYRTGNTWLFIKGASTSANDWSTAGNSGTGADNFIGTSDAQPLRFKVNNRKAGLVDITSGSTGLGFNSLNANSASGNTAIGYYSMYSNTTGGNNTGNGFYALFANTIGNYNAAAGSEALRNNTSGSYNTANGYNALGKNITGYNNTASGYNSLAGNTTGAHNTASGYISLSLNTTGSGNVAFGDYALALTAASDGNTAIGYQAGWAHNYGWNNTFIGAGANAGANDVYNTIVIGNNAFSSVSNQVTIGNPSNNSYRVYANWSNISDGRFKRNVKENVPGLAFINKLRPVTYNLDATALDKALHQDNKESTGTRFYKKSLIEKEQITYTGFVAQEVEATAKSLGFDFSGVDAPKNEDGTYGLRYAEFVVPLVKAIQELNEITQKENNELKKENKILSGKIDELMKRVQLLEKKNN